MKLAGVITCPLWEDLATGERRPVLDPAELPDHGRVAGWVNVLEVVVGDSRRLLLLGGGAHR